MATTFDISPTHERAVEWASAQFHDSELELVSESAWATTYRLSGPTGLRYLKILPLVARRQIPRLVQIAEKFPGQVPEIISFLSHEGWILFADHGGQELSLDESDDDLIEVARCFGSIQAKAALSAEFLSELDPFDIAHVQQAFMDFLAAPLTPEAAPSVSVGASYFIGEKQALRYSRLLTARAHLLTAQLLTATALPPTLCHGDLRAPNVALQPNGQAVFFDWDEAASGPAGMCLQGLFGGCSVPAGVVDRMIETGAAVDSPNGRCLEAYVDALVNGGYSTRPALLAGLVGSMCAGQMRFIISFGRYPGELQRSAAANTVRSRLSDLLNLCDLLASKDPNAAISSADDYEQNGELLRALRLIEDQLSRNLQQPELLSRYADLAYRLGNFEKAHKAALKALELEPGLAAARLALARSSLARLDLPTSAELLSNVLAVEPRNPQAQTLLERVQAAKAIQELAAMPQAIPRIVISGAEQESRRLEPDTFALMVDLFKKYGALQVDNVFAPDLMARLQVAFAAKYGDYFRDCDHSDALQVGDKRYMLTMELNGLFGSAELVASRLMMPFLRRILGTDCILSAYTAVISLPGSSPQTVHKDHSELFAQEGWGLPLPTFAAQMVVPLLALDEVTGATRIFKGTQRVPLSRASDGPYQDPVVPLGSCLFVDYSIAHCGMGNRSDSVRPILNLVYSRPWFRDCHNYKIQAPLKFSKGYLDEAPEAAKELVNWWNAERLALENQQM